MEGVVLTMIDESGVRRAKQRQSASSSFCRAFCTTLRVRLIKDHERRYVPVNDSSASMIGSDPMDIPRRREILPSDLATIP